jgi:hypothetical protein
MRPAASKLNLLMRSFGRQVAMRRLLAALEKTACEEPPALAAAEKLLALHSALGLGLLNHGAVFPTELRPLGTS